MLSRDKKYQIHWGRRTGRFLLLLSLVVISLAMASYAIFSHRMLASEIERVSSHVILETDALEIKLELLDQIFGIFVGALAFLSGAFTLLGIGLYSGLKNSLLFAVEREVTRASELIQHYSQAWSFKEQSFIWSIIYDRNLQHYLSKKTPPLSQGEIDDTRAYISSSLNASKLGLLRLQSIVIGDGISKKRAVDIERLSIELENHILYAETAELILSGDNDAIESLDDMKDRAQSLYDRSMSRDMNQVNFEYYKAHETVAFFRTHVGSRLQDDDLLKSGLELVSSLTKRKRPRNYLKAPPQDWCSSTLNEYTANGFKINETG